MNEFEEWDGSRSRKFKGGLGIVKAEYKSCTNFFEVDPKYNFRALENVKSKKHFDAKRSGVAHEWKPSLKMVKSGSGGGGLVRITELPCTTHMKPLRHVERFAQNSLNSKRKLRSLNGKKGYLVEEQDDVRRLEDWEEKILMKKDYQRNSQIRQFRSVLEGYRTNLNQMTVYRSRY